MPPGRSNSSGCSAHAMARSPPSRQVAGVFSSSSLMQNTRCRAHRRQLCPATLLDDLLQRHPVAGAAPRSQNHVGLGRRNLFRRDRLSRLASEYAARSFHQFCDPRLRGDDRFPPFFAEHSKAWMHSRLAREPAAIEFCIALITLCPRSETPITPAIAAMSA